MALVSYARRLVSWYRANARQLPWRTSPRDPYHSLVSELMAQQTQIDRVVPRFEAFVDRFPTLGELAAASEDEVLELWSGLGYYRRARLLHRLAREVAGVSGELPRTAAELERLPGIGPYTAAALSSMVFGEAVPVMDGNVARVGARVLAAAGDPRRRQVRSAILAWVTGLMADAKPGEVNEALMELGARLCTPTGPRCQACPLADCCRGLLGGNPEQYPTPRATREPVELRWIAVIVNDTAGRWLLRRVTEGPILRGLWLPPFAEPDPSLGLEEQVFGMLPFTADGAVEVCSAVRHSITHRRIEVTPVRVRAGDQRELPVGWSWSDPGAPNLPTSSLLDKLVRSIRA